MSRVKIQILGITRDELFAAALDNARQLSKLVIELSTTPLDDGEAPAQRALKVASHAITLAETFQLIDLLALSANDSPQVTQPVSQGCGQEGIN